MGKRITAFLKKHKIDLLVIGSLLTLALSAVFIFLGTRKTGAYATVTIKGEVVAEYSLNTDGVFPLNGGTNVLVIENGEAYFNHSDCPDHRCEKMGKVHYVGEKIVCLPNRVTVTVTGESYNYVDFVS